MTETYKNRNWLLRHYYDQSLSMLKCAKLAECSEATIWKWLDRFNIPRRTRGEAATVSWKRKGRYNEECRQKKSKSMKAAWKRGDFDSKEIRQKLSETMKASWRRGEHNNQFTSEARQNMSEATKRRWERGDYDGEETRQKYSKLSKAAHARGAYSDVYTDIIRNQKISRGMKVAHARGDFDEVSEKIKAARARGDFDGVFQSPTSIEVAISEALDELGIMHVEQYRPASCRFIYDEYLLAQGVLLEANGDYWHTREGAPERDARKAAWAREHGFLPVTIWEHEIKEYGALAMIQKRIIGREQCS